MNWRAFWLTVAGGAGLFVVAVGAAWGMFQMSKALEPHVGFLPAFGIVAFGVWMLYVLFMAWLAGSKHT